MAALRPQASRLSGGSGQQAPVAASSYCDHAGWGSKQGSIVKNWKRRYFVLKKLELIYFVERSPSGKGIEEKGRLTVSAVEFTPDFHNGLIVNGTLKNQKLVLQLESNNDCKEWFSKIKAALQVAAQDAAAARQKAKQSGAVAMEGWLSKEGQNFKTWKKRYMTLSGRMLKYHAAAGEPPLGEVRVYSVTINASRKFALDVYSDNNRLLRIAADSFTAIAEWDQALADAIRRAPCFGDAFSNQAVPFLGEEAILDLDCDGWLYMRGFRSTSWKKRYFTLKHTVLQFSDNPGENARGEGSVVDLKLGSKPQQLEIKLDNGKWLSVTSDSEEESNKWLWALCELLDRDPSMLERVVEHGSNGAFSFRTKLSSTTSTLLSSESQRISSLSSDDQQLARKTGWLRKEGRRMKSWKRRYFVLEGNHLQYFDNIGMKALKGEGEVDRVELSSKHPNGLVVHFKGGRVMLVTGDSSAEVRSWLDCLVGQQHCESQDSTSLRSSTMSSHSEGNAPVMDPTEFGRGWLLMQGGNFKTWKERYFLLHGRSLIYSRGVGEDPLGTGVVELVKIGSARPFSLEVKLSNGRLLGLVASGEEELMNWCRSFKASFDFQERGNQDANDSDDDDDAIVFDNDDLDDDVAVLEVKRSRPALVTMESDLGADDLDELDGIHISDSDERVVITTAFNPDMVTCSGWLRKEGGTIKSWKVRFFTLHGTLLRYFKGENGPLLGSATVVHVMIVRTRKHCFDVTLESGRKLVILAESECEADRWLDALSRAVLAAKQDKFSGSRLASKLGSAPGSHSAPTIKPLLSMASTSTVYDV